MRMCVFVCAYVCVLASVSRINMLESTWSTYREVAKGGVMMISVDICKNTPTKGATMMGGMVRQGPWSCRQHYCIQQLQLFYILCVCVCLCEWGCVCVVRVYVSACMPRTAHTKMRIWTCVHTYVSTRARGTHHSTRRRTSQHETQRFQIPARSPSCLGFPVWCQICVHTHKRTHTHTQNANTCCQFLMQNL